MRTRASVPTTGPADDPGPLLRGRALRRQDGGAALAGLAPGSVDLLLLDGERTEHASWWPHPVGTGLLLARRSR